MAKNRILVVEDDAAIAELICINLRVAGFEPVTITDGIETAQLLEIDHAFDMALLDIMLPGLDGFELLDHMRKFHIPVIYLTAKTDLSSKIKGLTQGAEDYIVKPFEVLELIVRVEKVLERYGKLNQILRFRDIEMNIPDRIITCCGKEIALKPLEFDLLVMLAKNKNRTLTRGRLLNEIWGMEYIGETRTVDVHIAQIRKKLDLNDTIKTISKVGYRLED